MSAQSLIDEARFVLQEHPTFPAVQRTRVASLLLRSAIEEWVQEQLGSLEADLQQATMRSKMICLRELVDAQAGCTAHVLWGILSRACHHHSHELAPGLDEVTGWFDQAEALVRSRPSVRMSGLDVREENSLVEFEEV